MLWMCVVGREWCVCCFKSSEKDGDKLHSGQPATVSCLEQWSNLVSGILGERCHNQWRAICADIKEVNTMNLKSMARHEDESSPPPTWQCQTPHQSVHKGGSCNNCVDCSPSSSLQSWFCTLWLPSSWPLERCTLKTLFCKWWRDEAQYVCEELLMLRQRVQVFHGQHAVSYAKVENVF